VQFQHLPVQTILTDYLGCAASQPSAETYDTLTKLAISWELSVFSHGTRPVVLDPFPVHPDSTIVSEPLQATDFEP
jgi:hypothetical protein